MKIANRIWTLRGSIYIVVLILTIGCVTSGCNKSTSKSPDISANSFRADPSKMTPEEKEKFNALMRNSQAPAKK